MQKNVRRRPGPRAIALLLATSFIAAGLTVSSQTLQADSATAATTSLRSASSTAVLANDLAVADFPSGSTKTVLVQNEKYAIHLASNFAARFNLPLVVATSGTSAASVLPTLATLGSTQVVRFSTTANWFSTAFLSSLTSASITTVGQYTSTELFARYSAAALSSASTEYVLATTTSAAGLTLATSYASTRGLPLVVWDASTPLTSLSAFFTSAGSAALTYFGDPSVTPAAQMTAAQVQTLVTIEVDDVDRAFAWIAAQSQSAGITSNRIVVSATGGSYDRLGIAGAHARKTGSVLVPQLFVAATGSADPAARYLDLWRSEMTSLELVGVNVNNWALSALAAPTSLSRASTPGFVASNLTKGTSSYTLTVSSVAGATSYSAFDVSGNLLATSSSSTLTYPSQPAGLLVVAKNGNTELARVNVRANDYSSTAFRPGVILGSTNAGTNHLVFLSDIEVPRFVTRTESDPFAYPPTEGPEIPVAITCDSSFTDVGLDPTKEYAYTVAEMTNVDAQACDPAYSAAPSVAAGLLYGQVPLPFTSLPSSFASRNAADIENAASPTQTDLIFASGASVDESDSELTDGIGQRLAPGDDWEPLIFRWIAYIPDAYVPFPGHSGDSSRPFIAFSGDAHGTNDPNGSYRFNQDLIFRWGSNHSVSYTERMGITHKYHCQSPVSNCALAGTGVASLTELNAYNINSTNVSGSATVSASATIPLVAGAPAIDTQWDIRLSTAGTYLKGNHDNMPQHELYMGYLQSEFYKVYQSPYLGYFQLPCLFVPHNFPITKCASEFNFQL